MYAYFLPYPATLPSSPVLPCPASLGGKLASRALRSLRLPTGAASPPGAERGIAHPFICHLCAPLRASRNRCLVEASPGHARRPCPRGGARPGVTGRGFKEVGGKGPPPRLPGWLRGSCEDSSTRKRRKAKAAETSQGGLAGELGPPNQMKGARG